MWPSGRLGILRDFSPLNSLGAGCQPQSSLTLALPLSHYLKLVLTLGGDVDGNQVQNGVLLWGEEEES